MQAGRAGKEVLPFAAFIEAFQAHYQAFYLGRQFVGAWCRGQAPGRADEQRVAKLMAQLVEFVAEGGLAQRHALGSEGGVAFLIQHMEQVQQVEVLAGDIHFLDRRHESFRIIES